MKRTWKTWHLIVAAMVAATAALLVGVGVVLYDLGDDTNSP